MSDLPTGLIHKWEHVVTGYSEFKMPVVQMKTKIRHSRPDA